MEEISRAQDLISGRLRDRFRDFYGLCRCHVRKLLLQALQSSSCRKRLDFIKCFSISLARSLICYVLHASAASRGSAASRFVCVGPPLGFTFARLRLAFTRRCAYVALLLRGTRT